MRKSTSAHSILGRECDLHTGRFPPVHTGVVVLVLSNIIGANVSQWPIKDHCTLTGVVSGFAQRIADVIACRFCKR